MTTTTTTDPPTIYARVKAEITRRGWAQYPDYSYADIDADEWDTCPACPLIAACAVLTMAEQNEFAEEMGRAIRAAMLAEHPGRRVSMGIGSWNDVEGRTVDDVFALLDQLDDLARQ